MLCEVSIMRLKDKVAVITGAGSGIGKASAKLFAKQGAKVVVADINSTLGLEVVSQITAGGGKGSFIQTDVGCSVDIKRMLSHAVDSYGRLDILFNNAGYMSEPMDQITEEQFRRAIDVMLTGPFIASRYAIPIMRNQGGGCILNTGSFRSFVAGGIKNPQLQARRSPAYFAAKGGLLMLTKYLAVILAKDNIRVNCICPGTVETDITTQSDKRFSDEEKSCMNSDVIGLIPMGRLAKPEEIASAALFLASDESSFVTGVGFPVDGGRLA